MLGQENQTAEDAAKPKVVGLRDAHVDTTRRGEVSFKVDMRPTTLLEQSQMRGYDRTTKPVGTSEANPANWETAGGRALNDVLAARHLGALGRNE
jgi:hypothetical protein